MAKKIVETFLSDLSGESACGTVSFGFEGVTYEIDLTEEEKSALAEALATYISAGRRVEGRVKRGNGGGRAVMDRDQLNAMREWGRANGFEVSERGRLSAKLVDAYHASA